MKKEKNFYKRLRLMVLALLLVTICTTISYAAFYTVSTQSGNNVVNTTCFNTEYSETSGMVNLAYAVPVSNSEGLASTPLEFTITNKCDVSTKYYVILNAGETGASVIPDSYLNLSLDGGVPSLISGLTPVGSIGYSNTNYRNNYVLAEGVLTKDQSATYNVRTWILESTTYDQIKDMNWKGRITVYTKVNSSDQLNN